MTLHMSSIWNKVGAQSMLILFLWFLTLLRNADLETDLTGSLIGMTPGLRIAQSCRLSKGLLRFPESDCLDSDPLNTGLTLEKLLILCELNFFSISGGSNTPQGGFECKWNHLPKAPRMIWERQKWDEVDGEKVLGRSRSDIVISWIA